MGKAARNRAIRKRALLLDPTAKQVRARRIAHALRKHGRGPLDESPAHAARKR